LAEQLGILLVDLSPLVGGLIESAAARTHDLAVVGRTPSLDELHDVARATNPDVVVVGLHDVKLPQACLDLLLKHPRMKVLGIEEHDGRARLYELRPEQVEIGDVSPNEIVEAIRAAVLRATPF
jgi:DNA-binding NarL/FixJ family response regulator